MAERLQGTPLSHRFCLGVVAPQVPGRFIAKRHTAWLRGTALQKRR